MTSDMSTGIVSAEWNMLNLPERFEVKSAADGGTISAEYLYDGNGQKLRVRSIGHAGDTTDTDYTGNAVWRDGRLSRLLVDGGYIKDGEYRFFVTDHLGSVRGVSDSDGHLLFRTHYYPYGSEYGYETGGTSGSGTGQDAGLETGSDEAAEQPYRYNGKEDQGFAGVPALDYGARLYSAVTGRWLSQDPLGEEYYWMSPYVYCAGNPVDFVDPEGMDIWEINSTGYVVNRIEDKEQDSFYIVDKNSDGEWERTGESISFEYETFKNDSEKTYFEGNTEASADLFKFLADNTSVEMGMISTDSYSVVFSDNNEGSINMKTVAKDIKNNGDILQSFVHSHPGNTIPSGFNEGEKRYTGDRSVAWLFDTSQGKQINHYIYAPKYGVLIQYNKDIINKSAKPFSSVFKEQIK